MATSIHDARVGGRGVTVKELLDHQPCLDN